jgi:hypothetical protein
VYEFCKWKGGDNVVKLRKFLLSLAFFSLLIGSPLPVLAQGSPCAPNDPLCLGAAEESGLPNNDIRVTVARIIKQAMGLLGIVAVVIILIGGFKWMTAGGNDEQTGEARKWIFSGIIGLAIILSAYALATYVINSLVTATTGV